jgi:hypothetical protein
MPIVLLALLMIVPAFVAATALQRGRARRAVRPIVDPCCPSCRYALRGLAGEHCPECGRDLEREGVIDRRDPRWGVRGVLRLIVLVPTALMTVMLVATLLDLARPREWIWTTQATLKDMDPAAPANSERLIVERIRQRSAREAPDRAALPSGRLRMIQPGPSDRVLVDRSESEVAGLSDEAVRAALEAQLAALGVTGPVDVAVAIARSLVDERRPVDPAQRYAAMDGIRDAVAGADSVRLLGTRDDVVWRKSIETWPRTAGFVVAGGLLLAGGGLILRDRRRGRPVPWSQVVAGLPPRADDSVS